MNTAEKTNVSIDAQFINAFLTGTMRTFQIQCKYEVQPQKSFVLKPEDKIPTDICGVIGLTSKHFLGSIALCFQDKFFLSVMESMFDEKFEVMTDELSDGAGELLNIIFGTAKTILNESGLAVEKALPTIIRGKDVRVNSLTQGSPTIVVPFNGKDGQFQILVSIKKSKE